MMDELSRRSFVELGSSLVLLGGVGSDTRAQLDADVADDDLAAYGLVLGSPRPSPARIRAEWDTFRLVHFDPDSGRKSYITHNMESWSTLPTPNPTTQVDELRTENFQSFFNHTFARPNAPDDKNWAYTAADVTKQASEIELAATTTLESRQRGNYPAGSEAIPGVAFRLTGTPTGGSAEAGYFHANDGILAGEDGTDSYVALRKGGTEHLVYRTNWNGHIPDSRVWVENRPVITRFPHLFYGGGDLQVRAIIHGENGSELRTLHTFTPENVDDSFGAGPPFDQPNLPVRFESSSLVGGSLRANAAHYEFGEGEAENRVNGEHFTDLGAGTTGWTPLIAWRKRSGWEMVNVKPLKVAVSAESNDAKLAIQLNPTLSGGTWTLPTNTSGDETAVEVNAGVTLDSTGERRWPGFVAAGQGSQSSAVKENDLTFNLPADQEVVLVAQGVGGTATLSGTVAWEEFF